MAKATEHCGGIIWRESTMAELSGDQLRQQSFETSEYIHPL